VQGSAEKGEQICHAHARQQAMALRREIERRMVLAQAVAEMRKRGKKNCQPTDLFMSFNGIQVTLAVMAQALIDCRIDCKTAGRMGAQIQMAMKLLRTYHRVRRETQKTQTSKDQKHQPQISADQIAEKKAKPQRTQR
jgi:hypothetical protein